MIFNVATGAEGDQVTAIAFESFGVRIRVTYDRPEIAARIPEVVPPGYVQIPVDSEVEEFGVLGESGGSSYTFTRGGSPVSKELDLEFALTLLQTQVRLFIAVGAPERIFVHAGAVAIAGRAVVLPGRSFSGKTSLVAAFLEAGATYLSDEFAVFDPAAAVHPFPTKLSIRRGEDERRFVGADELGAAVATSSLPVAAIVIASYRPGANWEPREVTRGQAVLGLLDNTVAAMTRSSEALSTFRRATEGPLLLACDRGDAGSVVADLMARLS